MKQQHRIAGTLFWLFLLISPLMDLINGIRMYLLSGGSGGMLSSLDLAVLPPLGPSMVVRLLFLAAMLTYLLLQKDFRPLIVLVAVGVCAAVTALLEQNSGEADLQAEVQYVVRYCYCLLVLLTYSAVFRTKWTDGNPKQRVDAILCAAQGLLALGVLLPFLFGMGFYTYADPLGYRGCRGFFYAGNDITAALLLLTPLTLAVWIERSGSASAALRTASGAVNALSLCAMLIIGTKTSFLAVCAIYLAYLVFGVVRGAGRRQWDLLLRVLALLVCTLLLLLLFRLVGKLDPFQTILRSIRSVEDYMDLVDMEHGRGVETILLSGRTATLRSAWADFTVRLPLSAFFGIGRRSQLRIIEMDLFEVLLYYGLCGAVAMLWLYVKNGLSLLRSLLRAVNARTLAGLLALGLGAGYMAAAGHVLFSVTSGFFFSFVIVYARAFLCGEQREEHP